MGTRGAVKRFLRKFPTSSFLLPIPVLFGRFSAAVWTSMRQSSP